MSVPEILDNSILSVALAVAGLGWWREAARRRGLALRAEGLSREVQMLRENLALLEETASHDRLTGAWNRRRFDEAATAEMNLARRRRAPLCLIILDLDHFKRINDTYGHSAGDTVLSGAAAAIQKAIRDSDLLARWGGEEFLILAPATGLDGAIRLAERARAALEATAFPAAEPVTVSAGVAEYLREEHMDAWIDRADQALYRAKAQGRNRVEADHTRCPQAIFHGAGLLELVWEEAYSSGRDLIDDQHILLFDLSNALLSAVLEGQPASMAAERFERLLRHAEKHFHDEEALLREAGYPDLDQHRGEHARLLAGARRLQSDMNSGQAGFGHLVAYLATDLVKGHLLTEDRHYFAHLTATPEQESRA